MFWGNRDYHRIDQGIKVMHQYLELLCEMHAEFLWLLGPIWGKLPEECQGLRAFHLSCQRVRMTEGHPSSLKVLMKLLPCDCEDWESAFFPPLEFVVKSTGRGYVRTIFTPFCKKFKCLGKTTYTTIGMFRRPRRSCSRLCAHLKPAVKREQLKWNATELYD